MRGRVAFTLVEVLITILLLTMLIATAMFSFKFFIGNLDRIKLSIPKKAIYYEYLNHSISGIYFYPIDNKNQGSLKKYFFKKGTNYFSYITTTPIYEDGISIAKVEYKDNYLIYYETKLYTKEQDYKKPMILKDSFHINFRFKIKIDECKINFIFYQDVNIPKSISLIFRNKDKEEEWVFKILSNHKKFIYEVEEEEF